MGALSGAVFGAIGAQIHGAETTSSAWSFSEQVFAHGMAGGVMSSLQGGKFGDGFISAGIMKGVGKIQTTANLGRVLIQSIAGGTVSKLTGNKFANGAITSAIQYLVNEVSNFSKGKDARQYRDRVSKLKPKFGGDRAKIAGYAQDLGLVESLATDGASIFKNENAAWLSQSEILNHLNTGYSSAALNMAWSAAGGGNSLTSNNMMLAVGGTKVPILGMYSQAYGVISFGNIT